MRRVSAGWRGAIVAFVAMGLACAIPLVGCEALLDTGSVTERQPGDAGSKDATVRPGSSSGSGLGAVHKDASGSHNGSGSGTTPGSTSGSGSASTQGSGSGSGNGSGSGSGSGGGSGTGSGTGTGSSVGSGTGGTDTCVVDGMDYGIGAVDPLDGCKGCVPSTSTTSWSPLPNGTTCGTNAFCSGGSCDVGCLIDGGPTAEHAPDPANACQWCYPDASTKSWTPLRNGTSCGGANMCSSGMCL